MPSIEIRELRKLYGQQRVLDGIDLSIEAGTVFGYIGPNGAGKTTTVKILTGMLGHFTGEVRVAGHDPVADPLAVKRRIGYVPENARLYEALTVDEFLLLVGRLHDLDDAAIGGRATAILQALGLGGRRYSRIGSLSKGMRQKVLLTSALLHDPEVLFLDEPLDGLDVESTILVKEFVRRFADRGGTVFYCSHMMDVVERVCDRIAILAQGRVVADGSFAELEAQCAGGGSLERVFMALTHGGDAGARAQAVLDAIDDGHAAS